MADTVKVRIPLLVGSNGKFCAWTCEEADWGLMADSIMNADDTDPDVSVRYWLEAEVPLPTKTCQTVQARVEPADG